jgi:hypothetical protein
MDAPGVVAHATPALRRRSMLFASAEIVNELTVMQPYVQFGFAGFCFVVFGVLVSVIVWLIKNLLKILKENNAVISGNTDAIKAVHTTADETKKLMGDIRDQLLTRPCMMTKHTANSATVNQEQA